MSTDTNKLQHGLIVPNGKKESDIKELLKSQYKIEGYNLDISEPLPIFKNYMPFFVKNIILVNSSL